MIVFGAVAIVLFVCLCFLPTMSLPTTFRCPLVPFVPCAGITCNMFMMAGLGASAWIRVGVWTLLG